MSRALPVLALLGCMAAGVLSGCTAGRTIPFAGPDAPAVLREERTSGTYRLRPPAAGTEGQAFFLEYRGPGAGRVVRLLATDGELLARRGLIDTGGEPARVLLPLPPGRRFVRVMIEPPPDLGLTLLSAGLAAGDRGFRAGDGVPTAGTQVRSWRREGLRWEVELEPGAGAPVEQAGLDAAAADRGAAAGPAWRLELVLECRPAFAWVRFRAAEALADRGYLESEAPSGVRPLYSGPERAAALITVSDGRQERSFLCQGLPGTRSLYLYPALVPFAPRSVRVEPLAGSRLWLDRLAVAPTAGVQPAGLAPGAVEAPASSSEPVTAAGTASADRAPLPGPLAPLPADLGIVLAYPQDHWRSPLYELYSWSRFPQVLIFDTADYAVQARFFKRLAFFVEKRGYRGRLVADREIERLHGFNAHDYRAEDLTHFFQKAADEGIPLHPEEEQLRAVLVANGILELRDGRYAPGAGAVISISRSSEPLLRRHLLTHEAFHGVFFQSEGYRQSALALWEQLGAGEREFWLLFFRWVGYDTEDPYLAANELQAYLFQQERRWVGPYFRGVTAGRLLSAYPDRRQALLAFLEADPRSFERRFDTLERALIEAVGLEGGRVLELEERQVP